jgi:tRNA/rRNA methyltransferase
MARGLMAEYRVVLVEPAFEESIGFVARAMKNFGMSDLHLVNPVAAIGENGRMRGGHAQDILDSLRVDESLEESLDGVDLSVATSAQKSFSPANLLRRPMSARELRLVLRSHSGRVGLVFGREGTGLNNVELGICDTVVTIPTANDYPTLNLSHAAAIIFYELYQTTVEEDSDLLAREDVKRTILSYVSDSAIIAGVEEYRAGLAVRALRNVLGRSALRWREGSLLAGVMRQISTQLKSQTRTSRSDVISVAENISD